MEMNMPPPQYPMYIPVPSAPIPPQFDPVRRPNKDNKKSRKYRQPNNFSHRVKKSKNYNSPFRPKNNPTPAPPQSPSPSQGGPAGDSNAPRSRSRSPVDLSTGTRGSPQGNGDEDGRDDYDDSDDARASWRYYSPDPESDGTESDDTSGQNGNGS